MAGPQLQAGYDQGNVFSLSDEESQERFRNAVVSASARPEVRDAVNNVYLALQDQIELRRPVCNTSGRCCRFNEVGHRLFLTTMEAAKFLYDLGDGCIPTSAHAGGACPFQLSQLCSVHEIRPFGCRIFFCDQTSNDWQRRQYEFFHSELRRLHQRLGVPYFYVEWRQFLRILASIGGRQVVGGAKRFLTAT